MSKILNYLNSYTPNPQYKKECEDGRISFIQRFPRENLANLKLEDYVVGGENKDTFSVWLEFKRNLFGIGGGNSSKFGVYIKKEDHSFRTGMGGNAKILEGEALEHYFQALKSGIIKALDLTEQDRISEIKDLDLPLWNLVLQKILILYFPDKFINAGSTDVLIAASKELGIDHIDLSKENIIEINYELRKKIDSIPEFNGLDYIDIGLVVWESLRYDINRNYYIIGTKYNGSQDIFPQLLEKSVIATGFASYLDLSELVGAKNKDIKKFLEEHDEQKSVSPLSLFLNLKPGDIVALKADGSPKGKQPFLSIVGIAEVVERDGEFYTHNPTGLGHQIPVKFLQAPIYKEFAIGGFGSTIQLVKKEEQINQIFNTEYDVLDNPTIIDVKMAKQVNIPQALNQILYGPPGTGKTYHTIEKAIKIINPFFDFQTDRKSIKDEFDRLVRNGQIVFTTFHQSMSYEDFIEGIKPTTMKDNEEEEITEISIDKDKSIQYEIQDGIFKKLCKKAKGSNLIKLDFDKLWSEFYKDIASRKGEVKFKSVSSEIKFEKENSTEEVLNVRFMRSTDNPDIEGRRLFQARKNGIKKIFDERIDASDENVNSRQEIEKILSAGRSTIYNAVYKSFFNFHDLGEKFKIKESAENFVLIIDEINRGNVSQIFGELITLIEEDKRLGKEEELEVILPYSKKPFGVPSNLYIIGTMNTADRSVEALDAALRRRFTFEEMAPKPELLSPSMMLQRLWIRDQDLAWKDPNWIKAENEFLDLFNASILSRKSYESLENTVNLESLNISFDKIVKFEGINFDTILSNINHRIELLLDKDHQIGHSYLINVYSLDQLKSAFQNKIIPLLQEYFFGDYGKIGLILGEKFFENGNEKKEVNFKNFFDYTEDGFSEKKIYRLKNLENMGNDAFKSAIEDLMN